ncbi:hypothetical protein FJ973_29640 [Mesorhizobium sp. B2-1-3]|uniref:hypothetical protein n=1 Tax=Mesorhizobium sp. B2-1-3 TaxID=2589972 RepID=UPI001126F088|nr:hypothetical protein [Mesorhizobium sp. B2-1-3]TPN03808.1 hypothetical protein FJ973_29640 [Mesorhizobium sp. B2-1-3]
MGNASSQNKSGQTNASTASPAWATPGSSAYNKQNSLMQTAPIAAFNQTLAQGGQGTATQGAISHLQNGMGQVGTGNFQNIYNQSQGAGAGDSALQQYASGSMLNGSPELSNIIDTSNQKVADQVNQAMSGAGRYGSGVAQGTLADSIASNTSNLLYNNYNQQQQNQMNAANSLNSSQQNRASTGLNAASGIAGAQGQNIANNTNNQLNAAGLENTGFNNIMSMIGALPTIQNNKTYDAQQQMGLGNQLDQASQNQLNDLIKQWGQGDMQDWARLGGLLSAGTQSAGNYGTQTATSSQPSNVLGALGALFSAL